MGSSSSGVGGGFLGSSLLGLLRKDSNSAQTVSPERQAFNQYAAKETAKYGGSFTDMDTFFKRDKVRVQAQTTGNIKRQTLLGGSE